MSQKEPDIRFESPVTLREFIIALMSLPPEMLDMPVAGLDEDGLPIIFSRVDHAYYVESDLGDGVYFTEAAMLEEQEAESIEEVNYKEYIFIS